MTANPSNTRELSIATLVQRAMELGGRKPIELAMQGSQLEALAAWGRDQLDLILDAMPAGSVLTIDKEFYTHTFATATGFGGEGDPITLPSDTVDVVGQAMYRADATTVELPVAPVDREEWNRSTDKDQTGQPTRMYVHRTATVQLYLLPVPDAVGATIRLQRQKLLPDANVGTYTPGIERHWVDHIQFELAGRYALQGGLLPLATALERRAGASLSQAQAASKQLVSNYMELEHPTGWS